MKTNSRRLLQLGLNLALTPAIEIDKSHFLKFQGNINDEGLDYQQALRPSAEEIVILRMTTSPLQILVKKLADQVNQLMVVGTEPELVSMVYMSEFAAVRNAYAHTWAIGQQVVGCDITMRCLYETDGEHAFRDLWEGTLRQPADALDVFKRPILGGGLRFVMPPTDSEEQQAAVEVKIESFLRDTGKVFVETQFAWQIMPESLDAFDALARIREVDAFTSNQVVAFMKGIG